MRRIFCLWLVAASLLLTGVAMAADPIVLGRVARGKGTLNWLGTDLPGPLTFLFQNGQPFIRDGRGEIRPYIVRRPDDAPAVEAKVETADTLIDRRDEVVRRQLAAGRSLTEAAAVAAAYLRSCERVTWVTVHGPAIKYQDKNQAWETDFMVKPDGQRLSDVEAWRSSMTELIKSLNNGQPAYLVYNGRPVKIAPANVARTRQVVAMAKSGHVMSEHQLDREVVELLQRPVDRLTLKPREEGR